MRRTAASLVLAASVTACGGNGNNPNSPPGGGDTGNPCTTAAATEVQAIGSVAAGGPAPDKKTLIDGDPRGRLAEALWLHREAERLRQAAKPAAAAAEPSVRSRSPAAQDIGEIAVLQDQGDLVVAANPYDLRSTGVRFTRDGASYTLSKIAGSFRTALGSQVTLGDDDSAAVAIPFSFAFYGTAQTAAFVNSDGNITFGEEDKASTERNVSRLLTGAPRVAPFLADLDPSLGGKIFVNAASDQYTVTWCGVHGYNSARTTTVQATLLPDGSVEMEFGDSITLADAVVGISPGHTGDFTTADLSAGTSVSSNGAIGERFAQANDVDTQAIARKFYSSHPDNYDQILIWTDQKLISDAFAYEVTVANEIRGIGLDLYDVSSSFGSAGRLRSLVYMDHLGKYPDDAAEKFLGENTTLSVIGQEVGHRWLAYLYCRDRTGATSSVLLGRDRAHWSFFFDSDASVMEGNEIEDLGGGQFRTVDAVKRYSRLDQYAMGLVPASAVPTFFYVESPISDRSRDSAPKIGVSFTGTRRDLLIDDVIAVHGSRAPGFEDSSKIHRQAFIYVVGAGRTAEAAHIAKLDQIRTQWETFFLQATEGRLTPVTRLR